MNAENVTYLQGQLARTEDPPRDNLLSMAWLLLVIITLTTLALAPPVVIYVWKALL